MPRVAKAESSDSRVIAHVDMDCFYVQVEQRKQPSLRGLPTAVVQYNSWKGGGLIAVGYEARKYGVTRSMRGDEAKKACPDIHLVQVPVARGKADLTVYRNAGSEVVSILSRRARCERASIDEVYLDLTEAAETMLLENPLERLESISEEALKSHVLGLHLDGASSRDSVRKWFLNSDADHRDKLLACGAIIVAELRLEVLKETEFTCSAGIAHNKMLAKLASGMNKPAQQTIVPFSAVRELLGPLPIKKMKQLGGKLGDSLQTDLGVNTVGDLLQFSEEKLQERCGINTGTWLWNIARGTCGEEVEGRLLPKSHGSGKTFPGRQALKSVSSVQKWLNELCDELNERLLSDLEQNKRIASTLTLHASAYKLNDTESLRKFPSKSCPLRNGVAKIQEDALNLFNAALREYIGTYNVNTTGDKHNNWAITGLSVSASKIVAIPSGTHSIMKYFHNQDQTYMLPKESNGIPDAVSIRSPGDGSSLRLHEDEANRVDIPSLNPDAEETEVWKDLTTFTDIQDPSFSRIEQEDDGPKQICLSSTGGLKILLGIALSSNLSFPFFLFNFWSSKSGGENNLGSEFIQSRINPHGFVLKSEKQKRKLDKEKGTPSILRFFHSHDSCSIQEPVRGKAFPESEASSSDFDAKVHEENQHAETSTSTSTCDLGRDELRSNLWNYKSNEIDPTVLSELPPEIQAEIRASIQPQKRANTVKKGSSIAHYFLPSSNS